MFPSIPFLYGHAMYIAGGLNGFQKISEMALLARPFQCTLRTTPEAAKTPEENKTAQGRLDPGESKDAQNRGIQGAQVVGSYVYPGLWQSNIEIRLGIALTWLLYLC